ncbi:hypothetical protein PLICRDRAFT_144304 [Plicaturopsis crispa FD-325 SS-3]|nr:hypothetical protein PLICRDRAFT_144304 [Plicaturopsis crispa FD-325 SS-3]
MATCNDREGWDAVSRIRAFDLTSCFEEGILLSTLLIVFFAFASFNSWLLSSRHTLPETRKSKWVLRGKLILLAFAFSASCVNAVLILSSRQSVAVWQSYVLEPLLFTSLLLLTWLNNRRARTSNSTILLFWPAYTTALIIWGRTAVDQGLPNLPVFLVKCVVLAFGLGSFALECLGGALVQQDNAEKGFVENPVLTANIFSLWTFGWMTPLMKKGASEYVTEDDLPSLLPSDESANLGHDLQQALSKHSSLWVALFTAFGRPYTFAAGLKIVQDCLAFMQPQLLRWLLSYISEYQRSHVGTNVAETPGPAAVEGFAIAAIMFVAAVTQTILLHQYFQRCFETGMRVRAGLVTAIYKKALILSSDERGRASGDIVNLMSVDATRLQDLCTYGLIAVSGPLQISLAFASLYNMLGWPSFVGVAIMIVSIPLNTVVARVLKKMQEKQMKNRDQRTRLMSELLANIKRHIKLYAWEFAFIRRILHVRNDLELRMLRRIGIVTSLNATMWSGIPLLVAFSSFAVAAVVSSTPLTSDVIFPSISVFMLLQFPLAMFSQVTSNLIEAWVSIKRISSFLNSDELQPDARRLIQKERLELGDEVLSIKNGEFWWSSDAATPALEDINLTVHKGELVGILGRVGAGKTSLLSAIVGDMRRTEGEVVVSGSIAYAPQNPWILSATVRDNIVFSHEYDESFYNDVIDACALKQDLDLLPEGDLTEVGEKGITLSGGQRARVSLARAVYARADLILLDDVLSAVDAHVARHIFDHVIGPKGLLSTKARVLVTHSIAFLGQFDRLAFVRRGIIIECDTYQSLLANAQSEVFKLIRGHGTSSGSSGTSTPHISGYTTPQTDEEPSATSVTSSDPESSFDEQRLLEKRVRRPSFTKAALAEIPPTRLATTGANKEHSEQGKVKPLVYYQYLEAASKSGFALFLVATVLQQTMSVLASVTLRAWGEHNQQTGDNTGMFKYLLGYGLFSLSSVLLGGVAALLIWVLCSLRSARKLHDSMLNAVMRAPLSFFELTPTGRILNLFSRDTYVVDQILGRVIQNLVRTAAVTLSIVAIIGGSFPPFLIAVVPLGWFYSRVMTYYLATSRELKRLDAVSRSPIFAWFSESLAGVSTIRAFNQQDVFITKNERRIDRNQICYLPSISVNRWLAIRLEFVGATIILITAVLAVTALVTTGVDAGLVGLVLSYALNTTSALNWVVRSASEVEQNIVRQASQHMATTAAHLHLHSVERILHYVGLPSEAPNEIPVTAPSDQWPTAGEVVFSQYSTQYRPELEPVLKNISMTIKSREKIGVCGRTGAGKSSLLLALFRIIEPTSGTIFIDGVDITKIGLHNLRSAISIVPQSPDLFEGTLRENIDPVGEHQDADIWTALSQAHLKGYVESLPEGLDAPVREGGSSLSSGQRQLLCFARALLRKSKILVLDEGKCNNVFRFSPTSAVDLDTDKAIQDIIRGPQFADVTMFTIAHRLNTIIESDRVLVLDAGKASRSSIAELDTPQKLIDDPASMFHSLAAEAGLLNGA